MNKHLSTAAIIALLFAANNSYGQDYISKKIVDKSGNSSFVVFKEGTKTKGLSAKDVFRDVLNVPANIELRKTSIVKDNNPNFYTEKYQSYIKGIKVEFSNYNVQYKNGSISSMNGELYNTDTDITPKLSASSALQNAIQSVSAKKYMWDSGYETDDYKKPSGELVLLPLEQANGEYKLVLAYKFDIFAAEPMSRANIYVSATDGKILFSDAIMKHSGETKQKMPDFSVFSKSEQDEQLKQTIAKLVPGNAETRYSGTKSIETTLQSGNYILYDTTRGGGVRTYNAKTGTSTTAAVDFTDVDNNWTAAEFDNATYDNAALDAHWGVAKTYDYFKEVFNRNSYNNLGTILRSYVHYSANYENAAWNGSYMVYGDGATTFKPLTAFDVTAHELGHGVCQTTAALAYQRESGAINEGLSDIWGAAVENRYAPEKQNFIIGEDIAKTAPGFLRSLSNPKAAGQPDTYRGGNWVAATTEEGCITPDRDTNDYCGVHTNSGILNHWYYILVQGKTGTNDIGKSYNVTGIGFSKASQIVYRLETNYLTSSSTYMNTRDFGIQTAVDLFGANSPEAIATQNAFYAVGLGSQYNPNVDTTAPSTPINLMASSTTDQSTYLTWDASTDNFAVDKYFIYKDDVLLGSSYKNALYVKDLVQSTNYNFKVQAVDEAGNLSPFSNVLTVKTADTGMVYCNSQATSTSFAKIQRVQLNTLDNSGFGGNGYEDFSYLSTNVEQGTAYEISITPYFSTSQYSVRYRVFIDYNNNGFFTDAGETAYSYTAAATATSPIKGTFTIPTTAALGPVRMRVSLSITTSPTSCSTIPYGQVEDYTLNIQPKLATQNVNVNKISIYPNPVKDMITIQSQNANEYQYNIYDIAGKLILKGKTASKKINAQSLGLGTYVLETIDSNGVKNTQKFIKK